MATFRKLEKLFCCIYCVSGHITILVSTCIFHMFYTLKLSKRRVVTLLQYWHDVVVQCGENPKELLTAAFLEMNHRVNACLVLPIPKVDGN